MDVTSARTLLFALACLLTTSVASADPAAQARFHDELARNHYKAGRSEQALREFFLEQRISPNPRIAFNIALCFQALKRKEEAFQYLTEYLESSDSDPERRGYAEKAVLALKPSLALVRVVSEPAGAAIYVDRPELGSYGVTPRVIALTAAEHEISVALDGHRGAMTKVTARQGGEETVQLRPERIVGKLSVSSPMASEVVVRGPSGDAISRGQSPLAVSIPPGNYEVTVVSPGYLPWTGIGRVTADAEVAVVAAPVAAPQPTGSITVTSNVPGARIDLNGEPVGFSPTVLPDLKVGKQSLRITAPDLLAWSGTVDVAKNQRSWLTVSLEEPPTVRVSPATWIAGGISAAALLTGGVLAIFAAETHSDFENATTTADRNAARERGITLNTATDVALITGAVAGATALVLYFTTKEVRGRPSAASLSVSAR